MHRLLVIGAGRVGAGYRWTDDQYTHAGACLSLKNRIELAGFVESDRERALAARKKWNLPVFSTVAAGLKELEPTIASVCTQPEHQWEILKQLYALDGVWCEKPWKGPTVPAGNVPIQVNYMRRGDPRHRKIRKDSPGGTLIVYGKDDETTRCHFEDLAQWWQAKLDYRPFAGPCAYIYQYPGSHPTHAFFDNGGFNTEHTPGMAFVAMLKNLMDKIEGKDELWSPAPMK